MESVCHGTFQSMVTDYERRYLAATANMKVTSKLSGYPWAAVATLYAHGFYDGEKSYPR